MKKVVLFALLITASFAFAHKTVFAQTGVSLEVEIKNIESSAAKQGISATERHDVLVRLARLRQLSGDIEGAARNWFEAAAAIPGKADDDALLSCAYCLAAMGEWDRAAAALEPLLSKLPRARFLDTGIKAIKTGDLSALAALADNPEYSQMKAEILFVLWKLTQGISQGSAQSGASEKWRQRLVNEFPQTPEGLLAAGNPSSIAVKPSPFWLFAGGLDSLPVIASEKPREVTSVQAAGSAVQTVTVSQAAETAQTINVVQTVPASQATVQTAAPQTSASQASASQASASQSPVSQMPASQASVFRETSVSVNVRLQTGVYSRQTNAQTQMANLKKAGFSPSIEQRVVNGNEMWAVIVPAGSNTNRTIAELRAAGFDSFPIR